MFRNYPSLAARTQIVTIAVVVLVILYFFGRGLWYPVYLKIAGKRTVSDVIFAIGSEARSRFTPYFEAAEVTYPPQKITFLATKDAGELEVWAFGDKGARHIRTFPIKALSGISGPKLREGDKQVPEGIYRVDGLNPNSSYHLSIKLNYPNEFDLKHARTEGRTNPGSNIFIHGKAVSIGCLAMGDEAIEDIFVLIHDVGRENVKVVIAPTDPRKSLIKALSQPTWLAELYEKIQIEFQKYILPET